MRDLTGAPSNSYSISQFPAIFISIQYAELMGYIVTVSAGENKNLAEIGFDPNYYYSIIEVGNAQDADGNNKQVCKLRNPWVSEETQDAFNQLKQDWPAL